MGIFSFLNPNKYKNVNSSDIEGVAQKLATLKKAGMLSVLDSRNFPDDVTFYVNKGFNFMIVCHSSDYYADVFLIYRKSPSSSKWLQVACIGQWGQFLSTRTDPPYSRWLDTFSTMYNSIRI